MDRTDEPVIQVGILAYLADGMVRHNQGIKAAVGKNTTFTDADKARAPKRQNEPKWHQLVNNALSPARTSSLYAKGFVEGCGDELHRITPAGLVQHEANVRMAKLVHEHLGDIDLTGIGTAPRGR